jgi:iron-sulfur cluster assembly protein
MVTLTESARDIVREIVESGSGPEGSGLRIAAEQETDGTAGLSLSLAPGPATGDTVVDEAGSRVFLESRAAEILDDKVLDAHRHDDGVHFTVEEQD